MAHPVSLPRKVFLGSNYQRTSIFFNCYYCSYDLFSKILDLCKFHNEICRTFLVRNFLELHKPLKMSLSSQKSLSIKPTNSNPLNLKKAKYIFLKKGIIDLIKGCGVGLVGRFKSQMRLIFIRRIFLSLFLYPSRFLSLGFFFAFPAER